MNRNAAYYPNPLLRISGHRLDRPIRLVLQLGDLHAPQVRLASGEATVVVEEVPFPVELNDRMVVCPPDYRI